MKQKWLIHLLVLLLISVLSLTACTQGQESSEEYPGPGSGGEYPGSQVDSVQPTPVPDVLYPGFADGDEVSWVQAVGMVLNGEVVSVIQTHSLKVSLTLKDGRTLHTFEPDIDSIFQIIENCGDPCKDIQVATE